MYTTSELVSKTFDKDGNIILTIKFGRDDSPDTVTKTYLANFTGQNPDYLKRVSQNEIDRLNSLQAYEKTILLGTVDLTPTQPQEDANAAYLKKKQKLIALKQELDLGVIEQAEYETALAETIATKP